LFKLGSDSNWNCRPGIWFVASAMLSSNTCSLYDNVFISSFDSVLVVMILSERVRYFSKKSLNWLSMNLLVFLFEGRLIVLNYRKLGEECGIFKTS